MNSNFFCIESQIFSIMVFLVLIIFNLAHRTIDDERPDYMQYIYWTVMSASACDILRRIDLGVLPFYIFNIVYYSSLVIAGFFWFCYCHMQFNKQEEKYVKASKLFLIPALVEIILVVISSVNGMIYSMGANGEVIKGRFFGLLFISMIYVVMPMFFTLSNKGKAMFNRDRTEFLKVALSGLFLIAGVISVIFFFSGLPGMTLSIVCTLICVFINTQYKKIILDNLTHLPNRYGLDEEIYEQLMQYKRDKNDSFYIIACDLDDFKTINDSWGHKEGDRALKLIADVLTLAAEHNNSSAFRIGGDEFIIITDTSEYGIAEKVCDEIKERLSEVEFRDDYTIKMSMGVKLYDGKTTISQLLSNADKVLYEVKRKNKKDVE